jgi:integrase
VVDSSALRPAVIGLVGSEPVLIVESSSTSDVAERQESSRVTHFEIDARPRCASSLPGGFAGWRICRLFGHRQGSAAPRPARNPAPPIFARFARWAAAPAPASARHQEIEILGWEDVDFKENAILLAGDEEARKSEAARRIVPMVEQLRVPMRAEWERQGRPKSGPIFRPKRADNKTGTADLNAALRRITKRWKDLDMVPITFQDSRHTAATWLDHAGVSPKVASVIMGHKPPKLGEHPDAAPIALRRYTHVLKGELERACEQFEMFLAERETEER